MKHQALTNDYVPFKFRENNMMHNIPYIRNKSFSLCVYHVNQKLCYYYVQLFTCHREYMKHPGYCIETVN